MIQSWRAASHPRTQLFSFGLGLTCSSPTITPRGPVWMARDQTLDKRQDRIGRPRNAKNHLIRGIIEPETRFHRFFAEIIEAAKGADHGDPWGGARRRKGRGPCPDRREPDTDYIEKGQEKAKPRRRICHRHCQAPGLLSDLRENGLGTRLETLPVSGAY
jgi:hypothetical protein